jgi:hypothetical protein
MEERGLGAVRDESVPALGGGRRGVGGEQVEFHGGILCGIAASFASVVRGTTPRSRAPECPRAPNAPSAALPKLC